MRITATPARPWPLERAKMVAPSWNLSVMEQAQAFSLCLHSPTLSRLSLKQGACKEPDHEPKPPGPRDEPLLAAAQGQPGPLVGMGSRGTGRGQAHWQANLAVCRLCRLSLVPR